MANFYTDNEDLRWYIERGIDWEPLVRTTEADFRTPARSQERRRGARVLPRDPRDGRRASSPRRSRRTPRNWIAKACATKAARRSSPPRHAGIFEQIKALGLHRLVVPRELGGMNAPVLLYFLLLGDARARRRLASWRTTRFTAAWRWRCSSARMREGTTKVDPEKAAIASTRFARGDRRDCARRGVGLHGHHRARRRQRHGRAAHARRAGRRRPLVRDRPEDLHHLGARQVSLRHRAHRDAQAKRPDDPFAGLGGSRCSSCKTYDDLPDGRASASSRLERVEEKLGHHGSVTAALSFERAPAQLIGKRGEGFKYMLLLMNNARARRRLREHRARARRPTGMAAGYAASAVDGQDDRQARDDRRLPRRDAYRRAGAARALRPRRVPRGAGAEEDVDRASTATSPDTDKAALEREIVRHKRRRDA